MKRAGDDGPFKIGLGAEGWAPHPMPRVCVMRPAHGAPRASDQAIRESLAPNKPEVLGHGLGAAALKVLPASWPNGPVQAPLCLSPEELHLSPADTSPVQFAMLNGLSALPWFQP